MFDVPHPACEYIIILQFLLCMGPRLRCPPSPAVVLQYLEELEVAQSAKGPSGLPTKRPLLDSALAADGIGELGRGALRPLVSHWCT